MGDKKLWNASAAYRSRVQRQKGEDAKKSFGDRNFFHPQASKLPQLRIRLKALTAGQTTEEAGLEHVSLFEHHSHTPGSFSSPLFSPVSHGLILLLTCPTQPFLEQVSIGEMGSKPGVYCMDSHEASTSVASHVSLTMCRSQSHFSMWETFLSTGEPRTGKKLERASLLHSLSALSGTQLSLDLFSMTLCNHSRAGARS